MNFLKIKTSCKSLPSLRKQLEKLLKSVVHGFRVTEKVENYDQHFRRIPLIKCYMSLKIHFVHSHLNFSLTIVMYVGHDE